MRKAEEEKQRKLKEFEDKARQPKPDTLGAGEQAIRDRQAHADAEKQRKLEQMKEMGKVMSLSYNSGI